jgi:hypothetical protein
MSTLEAIKLDIEEKYSFLQYFGKTWRIVIYLFIYLEEKGSTFNTCATYILNSGKTFRIILT